MPKTTGRDNYADRTTCNGRNQALQILCEFELKGKLLVLLADWEATDDSLAKIDDPPVMPEDIF